MAKILILTNKKNKNGKTQYFAKLVKKNFKSPKTSLYIKEIRNVYLEIDKGKIIVKVDGINASGYDLIYLRGISGNDIFSSTTLAIAFEAIGVNYIDTLYGRSGPHRSKLGSLAVLASNDLPIVQTICFFDDDYLKHFGKLSKELGLPFVAKELSQQRG